MVSSGVAGLIEIYDKRAQDSGLDTSKREVRQSIGYMTEQFLGPQLTGYISEEVSIYVQKGVEALRKATSASDSSPAQDEQAAGSPSTQ